MRATGIPVHVGDFCTYNFGDQRFNAITMVSLLEHLHDPVLALQRCYALLEAAGVLIIKTVNHAGLNRHLLGSRWSGYRPPDHLVYFSPRNLRRLLRQIGFTKVTTRAAPFNDSFYCFAHK